MNYITILGLVAAFFGTISFIPQVVKVYKTKRTEDISLGSYLLLSVTSILWTSYGILMKDLPIIIANSLILILTLSILIQKIKLG